MERTDSGDIICPPPKVNNKKKTKMTVLGRFWADLGFCLVPSTYKPVTLMNSLILLKCSLFLDLMHIKGVHAFKMIH